MPTPPPPLHQRRRGLETQPWNVKVWAWSPDEVRRACQAHGLGVTGHKGGSHRLKK